MDQDTL